MAADYEKVQDLGKFRAWTPERASPPPAMRNRPPLPASAGAETPRLHEGARVVEIAVIVMQHMSEPQLDSVKASVAAYRTRLGGDAVVALMADEPCMGELAVRREELANLGIALAELPPGPGSQEERARNWLVAMETQITDDVLHLQRSAGV